MGLWKMTMLKEVEVKALQLPQVERGHLVHDLLLSLDSPVTDPDKYELEVQNRIARIREHSTEGIPAEQVFTSIDNKYS
jgi:Putative addiction module component